LWKGGQRILEDHSKREQHRRGKSLWGKSPQEKEKRASIIDWSLPSGSEGFGNEAIEVSWQKKET